MDAERAGVNPCLFSIGDKMKKKTHRRRRKGQFSFMQSNIVAIAIIVLVVAMTALILQGFSDMIENTWQRTGTPTENVSTYAYNITDSALQANVTWSDFFSVLVIIIVFVTVITLIYYVMGRRGGQ